MTAPTFSDPAALLVATMVVYLGTLGPVLGRRRFRELARRRPHDPSALTRYYRRFLVSWWLIALSVPLVGILSPSLRLADLGLVLPSGPWAIWVGLAACGLVVYLIVAGQRAARMVRAGEVFPLRQAIAPALPGNAYERRLALAVSVTAGVVEEVYFRGLLIAAGVGILGLPVLASAAISLLLFAGGHLYQGRRGIVSSATIGLILTGLYLATGSLLLPMIVHTMVDINALLLIPASTPEQVAAAQARAAEEAAAADLAAASAAERVEAEAELRARAETVLPASGGLRRAAPGGE